VLEQHFTLAVAGSNVNVAFDFFDGSNQEGPVSNKKKLN